MEENRVYRSNENNLKLRKIVYYILGIFEALFAFRLVFKLLGANPGSAFVSFIYTVSGAFMAPFSGIFRSAVNEGIETKSVLEPTTIIAMIVYALIAYGVARLIEIYGTPKDEV
ncbi:MAG: YggT family protein [Desulfotomaculaceae bacterium]